MWLLLGLGAGIIVLPIIMLIRGKILNAVERRKIKREISKGNFLIPLDTRDYDVEKWQHYIDSSKSVEQLKKESAIAVEKFKGRVQKESMYPSQNIKEDVK
jgi:hypothetical protein